MAVVFDVSSSSTDLVPSSEGMMCAVGNSRTVCRFCEAKEWVQQTLEYEVNILYTTT